jgi:hypothetical protein
MGWQTLAASVANDIGLPLPIMLATVEAETSGNNVVGDSGNALGYGQVWPKWHMSELVDAANRAGVGLPFTHAPNNSQEVQQLAEVVTSNDTLSMYLAGNVIKKIWAGSGGDWDQFTSYYVGAGIPDADRERRRTIWEKYSGDGSVISKAENISADTAKKVIVVLMGAAALMYLTE